MIEFGNFNFAQKLIHHPEHLIALRGEERPFPVTFEIDLTNLCNHSCYFCIAKELRDTHKNTLDTEVVLNAIAQLKEMGVKGISFTGGGEPLVHKDFYSILAKTHEMGIHTGLMTNGALLQRYEELLRNLNWIRVSVGAGNRELYQKIQGRDDFELVIQNVRSLAQVRKRTQTVVNIGVRMLLDINNYHTLPQLALALQDSGIDYIQVAPDCREDTYPILQVDGLQDIVEQTKEILSETPTKLLLAGFTLYQDSRSYPEKCYAHYYQMALIATGDIMFCKNLRDRDDMSIGNIYQSTIQEIWNSEKCLQLETELCPSTCHSICKNMQINVAIERFLNPTNDMSVDFIG